MVAAVLAVALAACGCSGRDSGQKLVSDFPFLQRLGADSVAAVVVGDELKVDDGSPRLLVGDATLRALLGKVMPHSALGEAAYPAPCYIVGIKRMGSDRLVVAYWLATDGGGLGFMAAYDRSGRLTDYMNVGTWHYEQPSYRDEQGGTAIVESDRVTCDFAGHGAFTLVKENSEYEAQVTGVDLDKWQRMSDVWSQVREFGYKLDAKGHFVPASTLVKKRVGMTADQELSYAIDDLGCLPMSDAKKYDKINRQAATLKLADPQWMHDLQPIVRDAYDRNPAELLMWLNAHRDASSNHLAAVMATIYTDGLEEKADLLDAIDALPSAEARTYLGNLVDPWAPADDQ